MKTSRYIITPKREHRKAVAPDWAERVGAIPGVHVIGGPSPRLQVEATREAIDAVRALLGPMYHIEESIPHFPRQAP